MTPAQLSKSNSEHAHQRAFFAYCKYAELRGWEAANVWAEVQSPYEFYQLIDSQYLQWIHSQPNGANYGKNSGAEGAKMKAEGLKAGVWDVAFDLRTVFYPGLKMEFKKPALKNDMKPLNGLSKEQLQYKEFIELQGYKCAVVYSWLEAVLVLQNYMFLKG